MHNEISQAVEFLLRLLSNKLDSEVLVLFGSKLTEVLLERFADHWDVNRPYFGNGFRAISCFNGVMDPVLLKGRVFSPPLCTFNPCT